MEPGTEVDRYVVERTLGEGGMAVVYLVRHRELDSRHALKVLLVDRPALAERLRTEGRLQAALRHPHIVGIHDVVEVEGNPALVMELIDGIDLDEWIEQSPHVDDALRYTIARQILAAVGHAHALGTIHRDLKPGNVMVTEVGGEPFAKVADFGLAKALHGEGTSRTRTGVPMGTPRYMAPEQISDAKNVDERADVFAVGCILYELWTGVPSFQAVSIPEVFLDITSGTLPDLEGLPDNVAAAVRGCLAPDLDDRLQSCAEVLEVLEGQRVVPVPPPPVDDGAADPPAKARTGLVVAGLGGTALLGAAALVLLGLLGCGGLIAWGLTQDRDGDGPILTVPVLAPGPQPAPSPDPDARRPAPSPSPGPRPTPSPRPDPEPSPKPKPDKGKGKDKDKPDKGKGKGPK